MNTYSLNASYCAPYPSGAFSAGGSPDASSCLCGGGFYQRLLPGGDLAAGDFTCALCPDGATCLGDDAPLALAGYWHFPGDRTAFYLCDDVPDAGLPEAAPAGNGSNCRVGHTDLVCAVCEPGFALTGTVCEPCPPASAYSQWAPAKSAGIAVLGALGFISVTVGGMLHPIIRAEWAKHKAAKAARDGAPPAEVPPAPGAETAPLEEKPPRTPRRSNAQAASEKGAVQQAASVARAKKAVKMLSGTAKIVTSNVQIITSFKRTMRLCARPPRRPALAPQPAAALALTPRLGVPPPGPDPTSSSASCAASPC